MIILLLQTEILSADQSNGCFCDQEIMELITPVKIHFNVKDVVQL